MEAVERLGQDEAVDAVVVDGDLAPASPAEIAAVAERVALVIVVVEPDAEHAIGWLRGGADDVIGRDELAGVAGWRRIRFAVERRRRGELRRSAYSTDLGTGLPHRQQLVEHLSQLLALREREPAPMAVLAFRIDGLRPRGDGAESTDFETLRRKIAVRLRAGVRASDVVAADRRRRLRRASRLDPDRRRRRPRRGQARRRAAWRRSRVGAVERSIAVAPESPSIRTTAGTPIACCAARWRSPRRRRRRRRPVRRRFASAGGAARAAANDER